MKDYSGLSKEQLIDEIKHLKKRKKFGLLWEDKPEDVAELCKTKLPILVDVKEKEILGGNSGPTSVLIEGDNYHALSVLNYTHKGKIDVIYIDPPYNTGAKDWKYNNAYVDENDSYRHSKWLSMMHKRLILARNLLKKNGVLVVTIDDHELFGLLGLLEQNNAKTLGRVSICIKPEGRRQSKYIMEAHEYAVFATWGDPIARGINVDFGLDFPESDEISKFRWEGLMRRDASREDRGSDYWYAFYVKESGEILFEQEIPNIPKGVLLYEINGPLFFGASQKFQEVITDLKQQPKILILRMRNVPFIDATGINRLKEICQQLNGKGTTIIISGANHEVKAELLKADLYTMLGKYNIQDNIGKAIERAKEILKDK